MRSLWIVWIFMTAGLSAAEQAAPPVDSSTGIEIDQVQVTCRIDGRQLAVTVDFEARTKQASSRMALVRGDAVLDKLDPPLTDGRLEYDPNDKAYYVTWPAAGRHRVAAAFMARSLGGAGPGSRDATNLADESQCLASGTPSGASRPGAPDSTDQQSARP